LAAKLVMFTLTVMLSVSVVALPLVGERLNHVWLSLTVQFMAPLPVFLICRVWLGGFAPPAVALKVIVDGLRKRVRGFLSAPS